MKIKLREEILSFAEETAPPRLSVYIPTFRLGAEVQQNAIRLKNQLKETEKRLDDKGIVGESRDQLLKPLRQLLTDDSFWQQQEDGLALFAAGGNYRYYKLPFGVNESVHVGAEFRLRPLFPWFSEGERYYLLALNLNGVRLFSGDRYSLEEVPLPEDMPKTLKEAMRFEEAEPGMTFHSGGAAQTHANHRHGAVFHGDGGEKDVRKDQILRFFREIDRSLHEILHLRKRPLVLAGVEYLHPLYREANTYGNLHPEGINGAPENLSEKELQDAARPLLEPLWRASLEKELEKFRQHSLAGEKGSGRVADQLEEILPAATQGIISTLIYRPDVQRWGKYEWGTQAVDSGPRDQNDNIDLVEFAALHTLEHGGQVILDESQSLPEDTPLAAILRYS